MSQATRDAIEAAVREHVADETGGGYMTAFHVVAHAVPAEEPEGSHYVYATSDDAPHVWIGLVQMAERRGKRWQQEEDA